jgi:hypothetical protein
MEEDEFGRRPWQIEAAITDPHGIRVEVAVSLPPGQVWDDKAVGDCTEIAQMGAATAMKHIQKIRHDHYNKVPF